MTKISKKEKNKTRKKKNGKVKYTTNRVDKNELEPTTF